MLPIVIVVCLATVTMSAPTDTRPTTITAEEPEGRLQEESSKDVWGYVTSQTADGRFEHKTMDGKTIASTLNQLPVSPAVLNAVYPYPMNFVPGYGFRYFPGNNVPAYYPFYNQGQYDFYGNQETKSDVEEPTDVTLEQLLEGNGDGTRQSANPFRPVLNAIMTMNNINFWTLFAANAFMLTLG